MKIKKTIFTAAILMAAVCLPAQNKSAGINISICILYIFNQGNPVL